MHVCLYVLCMRGIALLFHKTTNVYGDVKVVNGIYLQDDFTGLQDRDRLCHGMHLMDDGMKRADTENAVRRAMEKYEKSNGEPENVFHMSLIQSYRLHR